MTEKENSNNYSPNNGDRTDSASKTKPQQTKDADRKTDTTPSTGSQNGGKL